MNRWVLAPGLMLFGLAAMIYGGGSAYIGLGSLQADAGIGLTGFAAFGCGALLGSAMRGRSDD